MTYFNIPFVCGIEKFCADAANVGVSGLIIPDYNLDMEAHERFDSVCRKNNLISNALLRLIAIPNDLKNTQKGAGRVYLLFSTRGVTGTRNQRFPFG